MSPHIALVTPWPPQKTGIADYAYDLACGLIEKGYRVSVITEADECRPLSGVNFFRPEWLTQETVSCFDQLIYQFGNNREFHIFQLLLLPRFPGVVHLHDMVLHHLMAYVLYALGSAEMYRAVLAKWYGPAIAEYSSSRLHIAEGIWDTPMCIDVPFFEEVVQHALGLISNSCFSASRVQRTFPVLPVKVLPQLYRDVVPHQDTSEEGFHIGIFGGVDPNKRIELIIDSLFAAWEQGSSIHLHIAGSVNKRCCGLIERLEQSPFSDRIHLHGRVEHDTLLSLIAKVDLCVAMRYPTMGETSAIVMRALQAGTPVIVSNVGWYAELPKFLPKLSPGLPNECEELVALLKTLAMRGEKYQALLEATLQWADSELQFSVVVKQYADFALAIGRP